MKATWEKVIRQKMQPLELIAGQGSSVYTVKNDKTTVWVLTEMGDFPPPPPPLDKHEMAPAGGREISLDIADADFLLVSKVVGVAEYTHHIGWEKIVDIVFRSVT